MNAKSIELQSIRQHCKTLRMPSVATQFQKIAEQAQRDEHSYVRYLDVLLSAEVEEREHRAVQRRLKEAQLPRAKTLEEFDFSQSPKVSARRIRELAEGDYIDHARPVLFLGDAGTGKTHLATALCVAACQQRRRVRFTTASRLVNELVEAREEHELSRVIRRYARYELLCIDELGYVPLADVGAERRCCTARSKLLTSLCRLQSHPAQYVSGIPSAAILLSISHPIRCSTRCLANVRARISGPMIAL